MTQYYNTPKKRIFLVFSDLSLGGVQTKMISLANSLVAQGTDCWIFLEEKGTYSRMHLLDKRVKVIVSLNIKFFNKRPFYGWRYMFFVACSIYIFRPTSIFVSLAPLATQLLFFLSRLFPSFVSRVVINEDTYPSQEYRQKKYAVVRKNMTMLYPKSKCVIAVSKNTYNDLYEQFNIQSPPLMLLPNWVDFKGASILLPLHRDIDILYAGRLDMQKQPMVLASVLFEIIKKRPKTTIQILGEGKQRNEFVERLKELGIRDNVVVNNPVHDIRPYLARAKVLLFTSLYEGLPFVGIEAMKEGVVIGALETPGLCDLIRNKKTGVMAKNTSSLVLKIVTLLQDPATLLRLRGVAYIYAKKHFSEHNRERLIQVLLG